MLSGIKLTLYFLFHSLFRYVCTITRVQNMPYTILQQLHISILSLFKFSFYSTIIYRRRWYNRYGSKKAFQVLQRSGKGKRGILNVALLFSFAKVKSIVRDLLRCTIVGILTLNSFSILYTFYVDRKLDWIFGDWRFLKITSFAP